MDTLKMKKVSNNWYHIALADNDQIHMLGEFLLDAVGSNIEEVKNMIDRQGHYNANSCIAELENGTITISHWHGMFENFIIKYNVLLSFLSQWKPVIQAMPSEIIIIMDDQHEHFTIQAIP